MEQASLVLTVTGPDRPGVVDALSQVVAKHEGNWEESRMAHLAGRFAGVLHIRLPRRQVTLFQAALSGLSGYGLTVTVGDAAEGEEVTYRAFKLELVGNDQPGIVRDIFHALAQRDINVEELTTECSAAPWTGGALFRASASLRCPGHVAMDDLRDILERLAQDLMVDVSLGETVLRATSVPPPPRK